MSQFVKQLRDSKQLARGTAAKQARLDAEFQARSRKNEEQELCIGGSCNKFRDSPYDSEIPLTAVFDEGDIPVDDDGLEDYDYLIPTGSNDLPFDKRLKRWALGTNQTHSAINSLLALLRETTNFSLPKDARTLLGTPTNIGSEIVAIPGGHFWYQGIEKSLQDYFRFVRPNTGNISVLLSIDGLPLHVSGITTFWPILMKVEGIPGVPIRVVAIFCGPSKPQSLEQYLRPLITELNHLQENGLALHGTSIPFKLKCFVADAPARAYLNGVKYFNAKDGCLKCSSIGKYDRGSHKAVFEEIDAPKRTDASFRAEGCGSHHRERTPLLDLKNFDIVEGVLIGDRLHLIDLGIMRKLLKGLVGVKFPLISKWNSKDLDSMSNFLSKMCLPCEIVRKMRGLNCLNNWKGSEYRSFLHYGGIVILKKLLPRHAYIHFLKFYCAITLFSSYAFEQQWNDGKRLLEEFILEFFSIYGRENLTSNVHNLQHICDEVCRYGTLTETPSYPFEDYLQIIKGSMRSGWKCLEQAANRMKEVNDFDVHNIRQATKFSYVNVTSKSLSLILAAGFTLKEGGNNDWFLTNNNTIVKFITATTSNQSIVVHGHPILRYSSYFVNPIPSSKLFLFQAKHSDLSPSKVKLPVNSIKCKLVAVKDEETDVNIFFPLIHTLETRT